MFFRTSQAKRTAGTEHLCALPLLYLHVEALGKNMIVLYEVVVCTLVMPVVFVCSCKSHSFQNEYVLNVTDLHMPLINKPHTEAESPTVNMISHPQKCVFFFLLLLL